MDRADQVMEDAFQPHTCEIAKTSSTVISIGSGKVQKIKLKKKLHLPPDVMIGDATLRSRNAPSCFAIGTGRP